MSLANPNTMHYRRSYTPSATYFFTVNLADRQSDLLIRHVDALRAAVHSVRQRRPFEIIAWAVLPEHTHAVWALPPGDADFSIRWMLIKGGFSRRIAATEATSPSRQRKGERGIWQRRFWEHQIRDEADLQRHVDYVHFNPVKHGHVDVASAWPWSSIHRCIRRGDLPADWGVGVDVEAPMAGEVRR